MGSGKGKMTDKDKLLKKLNPEWDCRTCILYTDTNVNWEDYENRIRAPRRWCTYKESVDISKFPGFCETWNGGVDMSASAVI